jgi:hypothetical protein
MPNTWDDMESSATVSCSQRFYQGILTEGEGSVLLTSSIGLTFCKKADLLVKVDVL